MKKILGSFIALLVVPTIALMVVAFHRGSSVNWIVPTLVGVSIAGYGVIQLRRAALVKTWPTVSATVVHPEIALGWEASRVNSDVFYPAVRFEYEVNGQQFNSNRFTIATNDFESNNHAIAEELVKPYRLGQKTEAFVCPDDPAIAVLRPDVSPRRRSHFITCVFGGSLVAVMSLAAGYLVVL